MIFDHATLSPALTSRFDVCIAGGGVAGIVIARRLASRGLRTLLLEGGGLFPSDESQSLYQGVSVGHDYLALDACRLRYLGGTSNHWAGWCRPLDADDFDARPQIPDSGWPISKEDVDPYLGEACNILEVPAFPPDRPLAGSDGRLREVVRHRSAPVRFGQKYRDFLRRSEEVETILNANLVDIELDVERARISSFVFAGVDPAGPRYRAVADCYVLATGGLENARILLNADRQAAGGIGNATGLVGRYFMDHPHLDVGHYVLGPATAGFGVHERFLALSHRAMAETGSAAAYYQVKPIVERTDPSAWQTTRDAVKSALCATDVIADLMQAMGAADCSDLIGAGRLRVGSEQAPNPASRVRLAKQVDRFGLRKLELDWQPQAMDLNTIRVGAMAVAEYFARQDIGRVKLYDWVLDPQVTALPGWQTVDTMAGSHHMGTTRMGLTARDGVVDHNCRVFGFDNLYVAGSSVFRTSGFANPTLTIVQLALRMADHLARLVERA